MKKYILLLMALTVTGHLYGQIEKQMLPAELKQQTIIQEPPTLYKGFFKAGLTYNFSSVDKWFTEEGKRESTPGSSAAFTQSMSADFRYGITDRITIHASVPYVMSRTYQSIEGRYNLIDSVFINSWSQKGSGFGDMDFGVNCQIINESQSIPSLTLKTYFTLPTGRKNPTNVKDEQHYDDATGKGEYSAYANLQMRKIFYPYAADISVSYTYYSGCKRQLTPGGDEESFKTGNNLAFYGTFGIQLNDWISLSDMVSYTYKNKDQYDNPDWDYNEYTSQSLQNWFYLYFQVKKLRLGQGVSIPVWGKRTGADPDYFIFFEYVF